MRIVRAGSAAVSNVELSGHQQREDNMSNDNAQTEASHTPAVVGPVERGVRRAAPERAALCAPIQWPRANPAALAAFDPNSLRCTMNCGPHRDDPRTDAERKLLCGDCVENWNR